MQQRLETMDRSRFNHHLLDLLHATLSLRIFQCYINGLRQVESFILEVCSQREMVPSRDIDGIRYDGDGMIVIFQLL